MNASEAAALPDTTHDMVDAGLYLADIGITPDVRSVPRPHGGRPGRVGESARSRHAVSMRQ